MRENFGKAIEFLRRHEGGYVNDRDDKGGETKFGISKSAHPKLDIKELTWEEAEEIYLNEYWKPTGCDELPWPMDVVAFDSSVQHGVGKTKRFLRMAKGSPLNMIFIRMRFYVRISRFPKKRKYLRGWIGRMLDLAKYTEIWR